jgi:hypothetical protein
VLQDGTAASGEFATTAQTTPSVNTLASDLICTATVNTGSTNAFLWSGIALYLDGQLLGTDFDNLPQYTLEVRVPIQVSAVPRTARCVHFRMPTGVALATAQLTIPGSTSCVNPPINKKGFRPGTTITYAFIDGGNPWGSEKSCVVEAMSSWSGQNTATGLGVTFAPVPVGQSPMFTSSKQ